MLLYNSNYFITLKSSNLFKPETSKQENINQGSVSEFSLVGISVQLGKSKSREGKHVIFVFSHAIKLSTRASPRR